MGDVDGVGGQQELRICPSLLLTPLPARQGLDVARVGLRLSVDGLWRTKIVLKQSPAGSGCRSILPLARALSHVCLDAHSQHRTFFSSSTAYANTRPHPSTQSSICN